MTIQFTQSAWEDYLHWQATDKALLKKINRLIIESTRTPFEGTGKPEPLKFEFSGYWSRRISAEHRLVYKYENDVLTIVQCRFHY